MREKLIMSVATFAALLWAANAFADHFTPFQPPARKAATRCEKRDAKTGECLVECTYGENNQVCASPRNKNWEEQRVECKPIACDPGAAKDAVCYKCKAVRRIVCYYSPVGIAGCTVYNDPKQGKEEPCSNRTEKGKN